jgi:hypothetical protein
MSGPDWITRISASIGLVDVETVRAICRNTGDLAAIELDSFDAKWHHGSNQQIHLVVSSDMHFDFSVRYGGTRRV